MVDVIRPQIAEDDYPEFLKIPHADQDDANKWVGTYKEWRERENHERRRLHRRGYKIVEVPVSPYEFASYCRESGLAGILQDLLRFAFEKRAGDVRASQQKPTDDGN